MGGGGWVDRESYRRGFEDAVELCLAELNDSNILEKAKKRLEEVLSLIKEDKIERLKRMLWMIEMVQ